MNDSYCTPSDYGYAPKYHTLSATHSYSQAHPHQPSHAYTQRQNNNKIYQFISKLTNNNAFNDSEKQAVILAFYDEDKMMEYNRYFLSLVDYGDHMSNSEITNNLIFFNDCLNRVLENRFVSLRLPLPRIQIQSIIQIRQIQIDPSKI